MRAAGAEKSASLPVAFVENSSHCAVNSAGEKVIGPNKDRRWLPELMTQVLPPLELEQVPLACRLADVACCLVTSVLCRVFIACHLLLVG